MNRMLRSCIAGLLFAAGSAAAGGSGLWIDEVWTPPRTEVGSYSKVLVVGITGDDTVRRNFENKFVTHLRVRKIECLTSRSIIPDLQEISPAAVAERLLSSKVDAVITVRLAPPERYESETDAKVWQEELADEIRARAYVESALAEGAPASGRVVVDFGLWDLPTGGRVWAARTGPHTRKKLRKGSGEIIQEVIHRLRDARAF